MEISSKIINEMGKRSINSVMKLLTGNMQDGVLSLKKWNLKQLKQKHLQVNGTNCKVLLYDIPEQIYQIKFQSIMWKDSELEWKGILTSNQCSGRPSSFLKYSLKSPKKYCSFKNCNVHWQNFLHVVWFCWKRFLDKLAKLYLV